jgi:hypothetical protein
VFEVVMQKLLYEVCQDAEECGERLLCV